MSEEGLATYTDSGPYLALSRCLVAQGQGARAATAANAAAARSHSPEETRYATYLAAMGADWRDPESSESLAKGTDVWAALGEDYAKGVELQRELDLRKDRERFPE